MKTLLIIIVSLALLCVVPFPLVLIGLLIWALIKLPSSLVNGAKKDSEMIKDIIKAAKQMKKDIK